MELPCVEEPGAIAEVVDWWDLEYTALDEQLVCPICRTAFVDPYTTDCGHTFCRECLNESWKTTNSHDLTCPIDRTKLTSEAQVAPFVVRSLLDELEVVCPFGDRGCKFKGKRWLLDSHVANDCQYVKVYCHPPCGKHVERRHFKAEACECLAAPEDVCDVEFEEKDAGSSPRGSLREGPAELREECPGSEFGCTATKETHGELSAHTESCMMAKLAARFSAQAERMNALEHENRYLKRQVDVFQHLVRRNAHELDSQILMEYDRLVRELREAESTLAGQETAISNLAAENTRVNAEVSYMKATIDNLHRQLFLLSQSQRRLSLHSSLVSASSAIESQDVEAEPSRRRSQQKL